MLGVTDERHERLREEVRAFAQANVAPRVPSMEASRSVENNLIWDIARRGWIGVTVDARYDGMGFDHRAKTVIIEELSRVSGAIGAATQASQLGVAKIIHFGNDEQKRKWLPKVAAGTCLPTIAVTEEESGGHVLGMTATAVRDGDDYILNGRKIYVGNSHVGTLHGVVVRTGTGSKGLTAFLVEADRPGLALAPHRPAMGLHGFSFGGLIFTDCRVPAANRLGAEGDGLLVAYSSSLLYGRPNLTALALGLHGALLETTVAFAEERRRYGKPLAELETVRIKIGEMRHRYTTARNAAYHAVNLLDQLLMRDEEPDQYVTCDEQLMSAKVLNAESTIDSARVALDIHGACGLFPERPVERLTRDAFHIPPPAGPSDVQLGRLAEIALGTYKGSLVHAIHRRGADAGGAG